MTIAETIREFRDNPRPDPILVRKFLERLRTGRVRLNGVPVLFDYADMRELFARQGVDADQFEELCKLADYTDSI